MSIRLKLVLLNAIVVFVGLMVGIEFLVLRTQKLFVDSIDRDLIRMSTKMTRDRAPFNGQRPGPGQMIETPIKTPIKHPAKHPTKDSIKDQAKVKETVQTASKIACRQNYATRHHPTMTSEDPPSTMQTAKHD
jgi:hypothetical protein